ncbi:hypothetical protein Bca52824_097020 [Brassica carinata]|uniref:Uncharacterized protein n=1 Tax=Brassica carinata TaxID=52824 RepID=A0A8X7NXS5_BRACI|nr:hypothetical protein Bca52824_097020 [Brassica carinata]
MIEAADDSKDKETDPWGCLCGMLKGLQAQILKTVLSSALILIKEKISATTFLYLLVADSLLEEAEEESSALTGWRGGLIPLEKKKLGVKEEVYRKDLYLIQSTIDYEVCFRADVFVGNSFSTFSSLIVLERTQKARRLGFAYNLAGESEGVPRRWTTNMTHSLQAITYGTNSVSCSSE